MSDLILGSYFLFLFTPEITASAAAVTAVGLGIIPSLDCVKDFIPAVKTFYPNKEAHEKYEPYYQTFKKIYNTNKKLYKEVKC